MTRGGAGPRLVDGRFELLQRLGGGGMGLVWRARDTALQRDVALKEVRPPESDTSVGDSVVDGRELRQRVLREARSLAQLRHPNVVTIHHIVDTPDYPHPWLVMELVTGGSLADRLGHGPLSVPEAARIGRGVLSALRAAHAMGILHRDVKPGNVLLRTDGSPVLTDFGIAAMRDATALTMAGSVVGSPEYIAPERLRGSEGHPASDFWSLAMMLYVAVEGHHPLSRATMLATLTAVLDEPLPPPVHAGPVLGPALSAMLVKDPAGRPDPDQFDRMLAAAEFGAPQPVPAWAGPSVPPAYPTPPSGAIGWPTPQPPMPQPPMQHPSMPPMPRPQARRGRTVLIALTAVLVLAAGGVTWALLPKATDGTGTPAALSTQGQVRHGPTTPGRTTGPQQPTTPAAPVNLLTPANIRATVASMSKVMGTKVFQLVVYTDHATAEAPTAADPTLYDDIDFRNGVTTHSPGGTVDDTLQSLIDLNKVNWDALPDLLSKAQATLKVPDATIVYVMVDSNMDITDSGDTVHTPVLRVYRADDYGGGMLEADLSGHVINTVPRS